MCTHSMAREASPPFTLQQRRKAIYEQLMALRASTALKASLPDRPQHNDGLELSVAPGHIQFQFTEANPNKDVCPTGQCLLAYTAPDEVTVYDSAGAWIISIPHSCIASIAAIVSHDVFRLSDFATAIKGIMHRPLSDMKRLSARDLFKQEFCLPRLLMEYLQSMLHVSYEWFASAWNRHASIPAYGSKHAGDQLFSSLGDAYAYRWLGCSFVNPGLVQVQALKAVRWAIASCYEPQATLILLVVPKPIAASALQASLAHPCVQRFVSLPARSWKCLRSSMLIASKMIVCPHLQLRF